MSKRLKQEEASDSVTEIQREPEHFLLKIEFFSKSKVEKYESLEFEAGGYKWRLILYPNGDKERNGSDYISLYLAISDTQNLPPGWEVEADFSIFVYNNVSQKYQSYKFADKTCFNWLKTESGFAQLMPLDEFKETSNGYLFGDTCVFGAEVIVTKAIAKRQSLSMLEDIENNTGDQQNLGNTNLRTKKMAPFLMYDPETCSNTDMNTDTNNTTFTWTVRNYSTLNCVRLISEEFIIGDVEWKLWLYPNGNDDGKEKCLSVYLAIAGFEFKDLAENRNVQAEFKLRIRNQLNTNHVEKQATEMFIRTSGSWGFHNLLPISDAKDESKGFVKNDGLVVEVEFTKVEIVKIFKRLTLNVKSN